MVERIIFFYIDAEICIYSTDYFYLSILFICTFFDSSLYWIPDIQRWRRVYLQRSIYWIIKCHSISSANGLVLSYIHWHCWCHVCQLSCRRFSYCIIGIVSQLFLFFLIGKTHVKTIHEEGERHDLLKDL